ncbi:uncharacterized protein LOC133196236 [Saccostrea echinata]|uniref:uncharacterized protein LOC133196236 n=1 Tax=Saccostrea echinata TaxID=191078 RepID=UPI002A7FE48A|nr:uncharacterized protein LOC133196236 [Saccostrea echinata]
MDDIQECVISEPQVDLSSEGMKGTKPKRGRGRPKNSKNKPQPNYDPQNSSRNQFPRSCRARQPKAKEAFQPLNLTWKVKEKRLLLRALKSHSPSDMEALHHVVKTKTKEEIEIFINKMKKGAIRKIKASRGPKAPIEHWLTLLSDLTSQEKKDYTVNLGKVVSIIANLEEFPQPGPSTPDYKAIYKYISSMLSESELPELGKLEAAVILDLLHGLVDFLRSHNTTKQREIMQWKYGLLAGKVNMNDPLSALIKARKAIENDFSDFTSGNAGSNSQSSQAQSSVDQTNVSVNQPGSSRHSSHQSSSQNNSGSGQSKSTTNSMSSAAGSRTNKSENPKRGRKPERKRTAASESTCPKKPTLFTMNPLCIPVNVIKMTPIINVTNKQLNNVDNRKLPNTQRLVAQQNSVVMYHIQKKNISPHPTHPIHQQQLLPVQSGQGQQIVQKNVVYVCEPHPNTVIVNREAPVRRGGTPKSIVEKGIKTKKK